MWKTYLSGLTIDPRKLAHKMAHQLLHVPSRSRFEVLQSFNSAHLQNTLLEPNLEVLAKEAGADEVLYKAAGVVEIVEAIKRVIERRAS
jgi:hypothetical protein